MFWADVLIFIFLWVAMIILGLLSRIPIAGVLFGIIAAHAPVFLGKLPETVFDCLLIRICRQA